MKKFHENRGSSNARATAMTAAAATKSPSKRRILRKDRRQTLEVLTSDDEVNEFVEGRASAYIEPSARQRMHEVRPQLRSSYETLYNPEFKAFLDTDGGGAPLAKAGSCESLDSLDAEELLRVAASGTNGEASRGPHQPKEQFDRLWEGLTSTAVTTTARTVALKSGAPNSHQTSSSAADKAEVDAEFPAAGGRHAARTQPDSQRPPQVPEARGVYDQMDQLADELLRIRQERIVDNGGAQQLMLQAPAPGAGMMLNARLGRTAGTPNAHSLDEAYPGRIPLTGEAVRHFDTLDSRPVQGAAEVKVGSRPNYHPPHPEPFLASPDARRSLLAKKSVAFQLPEEATLSRLRARIGGVPDTAPYQGGAMERLMTRGQPVRASLRTADLQRPRPQSPQRQLQQQQQQQQQQQSGQPTVTQQLRALLPSGGMEPPVSRRQPSPSTQSVQLLPTADRHAPRRTGSLLRSGSHSGHNTHGNRIATALQQPEVAIRRSWSVQQQLQPPPPPPPPPRQVKASVARQQGPLSASYSGRQLLEHTGRQEVAAADDLPSVDHVYKRIRLTAKEAARHQLTATLIHRHHQVARAASHSSDHRHRPLRHWSQQSATLN